MVQFLSLLTFYIIFLQIFTAKLMLQCCSRERFLVQIASNRFLCKTYRTQSYTQEDLQFCINPLFACNRIEFIMPMPFLGTKQAFYKYKRLWCNLTFFWKIAELQVNLFKKPSILYQLIYNVTRDCSLNSPKNTSSQHDVYKNCCLFWHSKQY